MADATVEALTKAVDEAVDEIVAVAAAEEEEVPLILDWRLRCTLKDRKNAVCFLRRLVKSQATEVD